MNTYFLERNFVLQNQLTLETMIAKAEVKVSNGQVNIKEVLKKVGDPDEFMFKIYDFGDSKYHKIREYSCWEPDQYLLPVELLRTDIVLVKFGLDGCETETAKSVSDREGSIVRKERSKERTILEVIEIVKQWRDFHLSSPHGKKLNLQQSAEILGVSKKSLDDYYYQLRLGEKYQFDFKTHLYEKIGVLRNFIKDSRPIHAQKQAGSKFDKHPKKLKIIEELGNFESQNLTNQNKKEENVRRHRTPLRQAEQQSQSEGQENQSAQVKQIKHIENQFYNQFEFLGQDADPFVNFESGFKEKNQQDQMLDEFLF